MSFVSFPTKSSASTTSNPKPKYRRQDSCNSAFGAYRPENPPGQRWVMQTTTRVQPRCAQVKAADFMHEVPIKASRKSLGSKSNHILPVQDTPAVLAPPTRRTLQVKAQYPSLYNCAVLTPASCAVLELRPECPVDVNRFMTPPAKMRPRSATSQSPRSAASQSPRSVTSQTPRSTVSQSARSATSQTPRSATSQTQQASRGEALVQEEDAVQQRRSSETMETSPRVYSAHTNTLLYSIKRASISCQCGEIINFAVEVEREGVDGANCMTCYRRIRQDFLDLLAAYKQQGVVVCSGRGGVDVSTLADGYMREQRVVCICNERGFDEDFPEREQRRRIIAQIVSMSEVKSCRCERKKRYELPPGLLSQSCEPRRCPSDQSSPPPPPALLSQSYEPHRCSSDQPSSPSEMAQALYRGDVHLHNIFDQQVDRHEPAPQCISEVSSLVSHSNSRRSEKVLSNVSENLSSSIERKVEEPLKASRRVRWSIAKKKKPTRRTKRSKIVAKLALSLSRPRTKSSSKRTQ